MKAQLLRWLSERHALSGEVQGLGPSVDGARSPDLGCDGGPSDGARRHHRGGARDRNRAFHHPARPQGVDLAPRGRPAAGRVPGDYAPGGRPTAGDPAAGRTPASCASGGHARGGLAPAGGANAGSGRPAGAGIRGAVTKRSRGFRAGARGRILAGAGGGARKPPNRPTERQKGKDPQAPARRCAEWPDPRDGPGRHAWPASAVREPVGRAGATRFQGSAFDRLKRCPLGPRPTWWRAFAGKCAMQLSH